MNKIQEIVEETSVEEISKEPSLDIKPLGIIDPKKLPPSRWVVGNRLIKGVYTVLSGFGGVSKTSLTYITAMSVALNKNLLDSTNTLNEWKIHKKDRVLLYNLEDEREEGQKRISAILNHYGISNKDRQELANNIFIGDGTKNPLHLVIRSEKGAMLNYPAIEELSKFIIGNRIGLVVLDPEILLGQGIEENNNSDRAKIAQALSLISKVGNCAVWAVCHSGKAGNSFDTTGTRGAKVLTDLARSVEVLVHLTKEQKIANDLDLKGNYVQVLNAKNNLSGNPLNLDLGMVFQIKGAPVGNDGVNLEFPMGDYKPVIELVDLSEKFKPMTKACFDSIIACLDTEEYMKAKQSKKWAGQPFLEAGFSEKEARTYITEWFDCNVLDEIVKQNSARQNKSYIKVNDKEAKFYRTKLF